jgi:hypothetical protein
LDGITRIYFSEFIEGNLLVKISPVAFFIKSSVSDIS